MNNVDPPDGVYISNKSGGKLKDAVELVRNAEEDTGRILQLDYVVVQLGTNDVTMNAGNVSKVIADYTKTIEDLQAYFPEARLAICSIPPRKGNSPKQAQANQDAKAINDYIQTITHRRTDTLLYVDTWSMLWNNSSKHAIKIYFNSNDISGIHLNREGKESVIKVIIKITQPVSGKRKKLSSINSPQNARTSKEPRIGDSPTNGC